MASDNNLEIVLSLVDKASSELKKITGEVKKDTEAIGRESEKVGKSLGKGMEEAGKGLRDFRREMFIVTAGIGAITVAAKAWAENNIQARLTLDSMGVSINKISSAFGSIMMPAIELASKGLEKLVKLIEFSARGWVGLMALIQGKGLEGAVAAMDAFTRSLANSGNLQEMKNKMQLMADAIALLNLEFMTGALSAQSYYDILTSKDMAVYQGMQMRMQLMQQMAAQENMMNNQSLMNFSSDIQARMGLLKTLQSYHHTIYSSMMDFTNMVIQKISTGMSSTLTAIIMGTKKAGEAWKEFGQSMITAIVEFVIQYGIQMLIAAALSKVIMTATIGQASAIASAWLPAAIFASISTMGGASAAGAAGLASATAGGLAIGVAAMKTSSALGLGERVASGASLSARAEGGWVGLRGPEIALVGERGPEYVVPNNRLNNMGRQTSIHIEINNPQIRTDEDIDKLTEAMSLRLARESERI